MFVCFFRVNHIWVIITPQSETRRNQTKQEDELTFSCRLSFKDKFRICICSLFWSICFCRTVWFIHPCFTRSSRAFRSLVHTTFAPSCLSVRACISLRHWLAPFISGEVAHTTIIISEMIDHRARQAITMLRVVWEDLEFAILTRSLSGWRCPKRVGWWVWVQQETLF